jgi:hypothetical protein
VVSVRLVHDHDTEAGQVRLAGRGERPVGHVQVVVRTPARTTRASRPPAAATYHASRTGKEYTVALLPVNNITELPNRP